MPDDSIFDDNEREELANFQQEEPAWKTFFHNNKKLILIASGLAAVLAIVIAWLLMSGNGNGIQPGSNNVLLEIKGPSQITSGNEG
jgi:hypothetical protein